MPRPAWSCAGSSPACASTTQLYVPLPWHWCSRYYRSRPVGPPCTALLNDQTPEAQHLPEFKFAKLWLWACSMTAGSNLAS